MEGPPKTPRNKKELFGGGGGTEGSSATEIVCPRIYFYISMLSDIFHRCLIEIFKISISVSSKGFLKGAAPACKLPPVDQHFFFHMIFFIMYVGTPHGENWIHIYYPIPGFATD